jgi:hypothetical protein
LGCSTTAVVSIFSDDSTAGDDGGDSSSSMGAGVSCATGAGVEATELFPSFFFAWKHLEQQSPKALLPYFWLKKECEQCGQKSWIMEQLSSEGWDGFTVYTVFSFWAIVCLLRFNQASGIPSPSADLESQLSTPIFFNCWDWLPILQGPPDDPKTSEFLSTPSVPCVPGKIQYSDLQRSRSPFCIM